MKRLFCLFVSTFLLQTVLPLYAASGADTLRPPEAAEADSPLVRAGLEEHLYAKPLTISAGLEEVTTELLTTQQATDAILDSSANTLLFENEPALRVHPNGQKQIQGVLEQVAELTANDHVAVFKKGVEIAELGTDISMIRLSHWMQEQAQMNLNKSPVVLVRQGKTLSLLRTSNLLLTLYQTRHPNSKQTPTVVIWGFHPDRPQKAGWLTIAKGITGYPLQEAKAWFGLYLPETVLVFRDEIWNGKIMKGIREAGGFGTSKGRRILLQLQEDLHRREHKRTAEKRTKEWVRLDRKADEHFLFLDIHDSDPRNWRIIAAATVSEIQLGQDAVKVIFSAYPDVRVDKDWIALTKAKEQGLALPPPPGIVVRQPAASSGGLEERMEQARAALRQIIQERGKIAVLIEPAAVSYASAKEFAEATRRLTPELRGMNGYPVIEIRPLSAEAVAQYQADGYQVVQVKLEPRKPILDPNIVYVRLPAGSERLIPKKFLPLLVTDAVALWQKAKGKRLSSPIILPAAPYLNARGVSFQEIRRTLTDFFA